MLRTNNTRADVLELTDCPKQAARIPVTNVPSLNAILIIDTTPQWFYLWHARLSFTWIYQN